MNSQKERYLNLRGRLAYDEARYSGRMQKDLQDTIKYLDDIQEYIDYELETLIRRQNTT